MTWDQLHALTTDELRELRRKALAEAKRATLMANQARAVLGAREAKRGQREAAKAKREWEERQRLGQRLPELTDWLDAINRGGSGA